MHSVAGRQSMIGQDDLLRSFCRAPIYRQHLIHDSENSIERNLNVLAPMMDE
jgi:hypothetical protein